MQRRSPIPNNPTVLPTVLRRQLALWLRRLRRDGGMMQEEVAEALLWSSSKISRMENGPSGAEPSQPGAG